MTKIEIAKRATSLVVGFGTSAIVAGFIKNNSAPSNTAEQVAMPVAGFVLGMMAVEVTRKYTDAKFDDAVAWWNENVKK
jgi:hypothetical protein